jgi:hypothetical protein
MPCSANKKGDSTSPSLHNSTPCDSSPQHLPHSLAPGTEVHCLPAAWQLACPRELSWEPAGQSHLRRRGAAGMIGPGLCKHIHPVTFAAAEAMLDHHSVATIIQ